MPFLLRGHKSQHNNEPVLVYWDGIIAVHVEAEGFLRDGFTLPNGEVITEPVQFLTYADAAAAALLIPMKQTVIDTEFVKAEDGKVTELKLKPFTLPVDPPQKPARNIKLEALVSVEQKP